MTDTDRTEEAKRLSEAEYILAVNQLPAVLKYAHFFYQVLKDKSEVEKITIPMIAEGVEVPVFRGNLTQAYESTGASKGYYSEIRRLLTEYGSIHILERGTIHAPSVVVVTDQLPPMSKDVIVNSPPEALTDRSEPFRLLSRRVEILQERLGGPEGINILAALENMERRLAKLEDPDGETKISGQSVKDEIPQTDEESTTKQQG